MNTKKKWGGTVNNIDLDRLQEQHDEQLPGCPWLDNDNFIQEDGNYYSKDTYDAMVKADMEED